MATLCEFRSAGAISACSIYDAGNVMRGRRGIGRCGFSAGNERLGKLPSSSGSLQLRNRLCRSVSCAAYGKDADVDMTGDEIADDYYSILGVTPDASPEEIKKAYYSCMKACHPDLAGENAETTEFCMFINEVYEILSDPVQRMVYDEISGYSTTSVNPFLDRTKPANYVFVDEFACIGCKNCANTDPDTFEIEEAFGRARAISQCGRRTSLVQDAIDTCPVDCIHWVSASQLSLLEDEMRRVERVNVGVMLSGMGGSAADVFGWASRRWEKKQARAVEAAKIRKMKEKNTSSGPWWQDLWNQNQADTQSEADPEVQERAARAAAAARRWREYSRRGVDRKPVYNLPSSVASKSTSKESDKRQREVASK